MRFPILAARLALIALLPGRRHRRGGGDRRACRNGVLATGLELMAGSVALALIALLLAAIWLVFALRHNRGDAKRAGMTAFIGALLLLYAPLHTVYQGLMAPPIHDVTTDPEDPPRFVALAGHGRRRAEKPPPSICRRKSIIAANTTRSATYCTPIIRI